MMDAVALSAAVKKLQEANPTLQYNIDEDGMVRVNGIDYRTYYDKVQETINTPPAESEPEETTEEPLAVPEPDSLTIEEPPAAPKPEPQAIIHETTPKNTKIIVQLITIAPEALPKPTLKIINTPEALPKPTPKIIDEYPVESKPDPPPPAARASDTGQDIKEV